MIVVQGEIRVHPDDMPAVRALAAPLIAATRAEPGNQAYAFAEDLSEPGLIHVVERWADEASITAHNATPHLAAFTGGFLKLRVLGLKIVGYDAPEGRVLLGG